MNSWILVIRDRYAKSTSNHKRTIVFEGGKPSDRQVAFEKGSACYAWYCMPRELDVTLMELCNDRK